MPIDEEFCIKSNCEYYFGEISYCMYGEDGIPTDGIKACDNKNENGEN